MSNTIESRIESLSKQGLSVTKIPTSGIIDNHYNRNIMANFTASLRHLLPQMTYRIAEVLVEEAKEVTGYELSWHSGHRPSHTFGGRV